MHKISARTPMTSILVNSCPARTAHPTPRSHILHPCGVLSASLCLDSTDRIHSSLFEGGRVGNPAKIPARMFAKANRMSERWRNKSMSECYQKRSKQARSRHAGGQRRPASPAWYTIKWLQNAARFQTETAVAPTMLPALIVGFRQARFRTKLEAPCWSLVRQGAWYICTQEYATYSSSPACAPAIK